MSHKQILFHSAAREKVLRGESSLADAVRVTLGPKSKSVLIGKKWGTPIVGNDGVTIAKEFDLKDPEENLGAQMIRQVMHHHPAIPSLLAVSALLAGGCGAPAPASAPVTAGEVGRVQLTLLDAETAQPLPLRDDRRREVRARLEPCLGPSGGKLELRLRVVGGQLTAEVEPGSSLDPTRQRCVLDALSVIQDDVTRPPWTGATAPPSGFTSLVQIAW
jgi:hypothetical protein